MSDPLRPLPLAELRLQARTWRVNQRIAGLDSLTPVQGHLQAIHHGTALEVCGEAETIVTLCCDRCLQHFNHALRAEVRELVELRGPSSGSEADAEEINLELARAGMPDGDDLDDRLDPAGRFDPERWLFEQLSLRLPLVNRCGADCPGPATWSSDPRGNDPRWAALAQLGRPGLEPDADGRSTARRAAEVIPEESSSIRSAFSRDQDSPASRPPQDESGSPLGRAVLDNGDAVVNPVA